MGEVMGEGLGEVMGEGLGEVMGEAMIEAICDGVYAAQMTIDGLLVGSCSQLSFSPVSSFARGSPCR